jgi:hypothetical protein
MATVERFFDINKASAPPHSYTPRLRSSARAEAIIVLPTKRLVRRWFSPIDLCSERIADKIKRKATTLLESIVDG